MGSQEIGRSRGDLTTKLHVAVDALGDPLRVILSVGQIAGIKQAAALIKDQPSRFIVAGKGYGSHAFVQTISARGAQAVIPPRSNCLNPRTFDRHLYQDRNLIKHFFAHASPRASTSLPSLSCPSFISPALSSGWLDGEHTLA